MEDSIEDQVLQEVLKLDAKFQTGNTIRKKIVEKLSASLDSMTISNRDNPKLLEAQMTLVNTLLKTVNDDESQHMQAIKIRQSIKRDKDNNDNASSIANIITEYIKNIKPTELLKNGDVSEENPILDKVIAEENFEILEGELEMSNVTTEVDE